MIMKKAYSSKWIMSKKPRKQRKYVANAPLHKKRIFMSSHLSRELREKYKKRSMPIIVGDEVLVKAGKYKGKSGKVTKLNRSKLKVYLDSVKIEKMDGSQKHAPIHASNLLITKLKLEDTKRVQLLKRKENVKTS